MRNPQLCERVRYTGKLFPELEGDTYTIVQVYPTSIDPQGIVEVIGDKSWVLLKKSRLDFERVKACHQRK